MDKVLYNIESKEFREINQEIAIRLSGWCLIDEKDVFTLELITSLGKKPPLKVKRVVRNDVEEEYKEYFTAEQTDGAGFYVYAKCSLDELGDGISLYTENGDFGREIYTESSDEILEIAREKSISYSVDFMDMTGDNIILSGWALTMSGRLLDIGVSDAEGNNIEADCIHSLRPDVCNIYEELPKDYQAGFRLKFKDSKSNVYKIAIYNDVEKTVVNITRKKILEEARKNSKSYTVPEAIKEELTGGHIKADLSIFFRKGVAGLKREWHIRYVSGVDSYDSWYRKHELTEQELEEQAKTEFAYSPKISIIVPAYHTPRRFLKQMIASVQAQTYSNWELCIADGGADDDTVEKNIKHFIKKDDRIKYKKLEKNEGISGNTNRAIELATGDCFALLDHDDLLTSDALYEVVKAFNEDTLIDAVYSDEDKVTMDLKTYFEPHFKSDYNLDLLRSNNYICHLFAVKKDIVDAVGVFDPRYDGSQDYDFILRCTERARKIHHVKKILYHWRTHPASTAADPASKMYCFEAGRRAIEDHLKRVGVNAEVEMIPDFYGFYRVKYAENIIDCPKVSIVIPNKDEKETLETCINSIFEKTRYPDYEIIIVENNSITAEIFDYYKEIQKDSRVKVIRWRKEFNYSAINNFGVKNAKGDYLLLLNNDTEVVTEGWLSTLMTDVRRENIGAVGVKLLYPDGTIQHSGVAIGLGGIAGHIFSGADAQFMGYNGRAQLQQNVSAVTAACMMVPRKVYEQVGGFDENIKVAFNDVDFCLKIREAGYLLLYDPFVMLDHYESKSRGYDDTAEKSIRFQREVFYMKDKWGELLDEDPYYTKNFLEYVAI